MAIIRDVSCTDQGCKFLPAPCSKRREKRKKKQKISLDSSGREGLDSTGNVGRQFADNRKRSSVTGAATGRQNARNEDGSQKREEENEKEGG